MPPAFVEVESRVQGTTQIVAVHGEIDLASVAKVQRSLDHAQSQSPEIVVLDLSAVTFCDSSGVRMVVAAHRRANRHGCGFVVVRPAGAAWRTFEICRLDRALPFVGARPAVEPRSAAPHAEEAGSETAGGVPGRSVAGAAG